MILAVPIFKYFLNCDASALIISASIALASSIENAVLPTAVAPQMIINLIMIRYA